MLLLKLDCCLTEDVGITWFVPVFTARPPIVVAFRCCCSWLFDNTVDDWLFTIPLVDWIQDVTESGGDAVVNVCGLLLWCGRYFCCNCKLLLDPVKQFVDTIFAAVLPVVIVVVPVTWLPVRDVTYIGDASFKKL